MRERRYLTFDMESPRHREAFDLFSAQSAKRRSEYVVDCIIKAQEFILNNLKIIGETY